MASEIFESAGPSYPNGCHLCEVEVDPETGRVMIERFVMVADPGRVINPLIVEGQLHGGIAQGIGQALLERVAYDPGSGQLLSGSFMDFALPRADDLPMIDTVLRPIHSDDNPLGVKGIGEGPTTGSPPAVVNAVLDALAERGVRQLEMPLTPERVWRALRQAEGAKGG
jgi:carbon-monoxide dehydrogenase large subunit